MKNNLRKIVIENKEYLYRISDTYYPISYNKLTIRIFLSGYKHTPLIIEFCTIDDFHTGQVLLKGIKLYNTEIQNFVSINFNEPGYIRLLILWGIQKGWTGKNNIPVQDGMEFLRESGYEINHLYS